MRCFARGRRDGHDGVGGVVARVDSGQDDGDGGADAVFGVQADIAAGGGGDAVNGGQAEAGTGSFGLGGVERLEGAFDHLRWHAGAGVADADAHVPPDRQR